MILLKGVGERQIRRILDLIMNLAKFGKATNVWING